MELCCLLAEKGPFPSFNFAVDKGSYTHFGGCFKFDWFFCYLAFKVDATRRFNFLELFHAPHIVVEVHGVSSLFSSAVTEVRMQSWWCFLVGEQGNSVIS